jgi:heat shock protein HslJ
MPAPPRIIPTLLAAAVLLVACTGGASPGGSEPPGPGGPGAIDGRTFLSTAIAGRALVPGSQVRLSFEGDRIGASAGCNSMGGSYAVDGGRLVVGALATTEMGCDPALMDQDTWLGGFLDGASIALAGDMLTLAKDGVTLTLLDREVADPDRPLVGTRWVVDGLVSGDAVSSVPAGVVATLAFSDGEVAVEAGCNSGGGTAEIGETTITFGPIALTEMACGPDAMAVEQAVTAVLSGTADYAIEADSLSLSGAGVGLLLRAAP